jgi:hypothetical protein
LRWWWWWKEEDMLYNEQKINKSIQNIFEKDAKAYEKKEEKF